MARQQGKTFDEKVLHTIAETTNDKGGGTSLRIVSWVVDGKTFSPKIEKRYRSRTEDGSWRVGRAEGLTAFDFLAVLRDIDNVAKHLQIPATDILLALNEERRTLQPAAAGNGKKEAF